ncbi:MAG: protein kinase [Verrucomicrobiota bacterium]
MHVAHNETDRFFYYIMEIADDAIAGQQFDAANYTPLTLAALVRKEAELPLPRCLQIAVALTEALGFLHQQKLVHRDIKPANIIFVNGTPKLADIDLVTDIAPEGKPCTCLGTFGYIPPEGPGTPVADIYSFGKVLYDLSFGRQKRTFPDIQTSLVMGNPESPLFQLNEIIIKSCENDPRDRYQSMAELRAALLTLPNS